MSETLLAALKTNNLQEAKNLLESGGTLPAGLSANEYLQLLDKLLRDSAFDLIHLLLKVKPIETDIYTYDTFTGTFFEKLFFYIKNNEQAISFLDGFLTTVENINEDLMGLTLLAFAIEKAADPAVIKSLVKAGSDVNFVNNAEENLLHLMQSFVWQ